MSTLIRNASALHKECNSIDPKGTRRYLLISDFGNASVTSEQGFEISLFRLFTPVKGIKGRKLNSYYGEQFNPYKDSLMDYPTIVRFKLGKVRLANWEKYNRLVSVHASRCPLNCWHCYVDDCLKAECNDCAASGYCDRTQKDRLGIKQDWFTAKEIVDKFLRQREADKNRNHESNIIRITGGEPFLVPDLIIEVLRELETLGLSSEIFLWTETNLVPFISSENNEGIVKDSHLEELSRYANFCIHPCFHGLNKQEFADITGQEIGNYDDLLNAFKRIVNANIDVYPTFGSNMVSAASLGLFYKKITEINESLPLRFALVEYDLDYIPIRLRRSNVPNFAKEHEKVYDRYSVIEQWDKLLKASTGYSYAEKPRHLISLSGEEFDERR
jgi:uncharacterized Fe-S cluster-containing radical SAM superfamily protein